MAIPSGEVHVEQSQNGIAYLTFSHPAHNSMPASLLAETVEALDRLGNDEHVQVIVFQSGGDRTFCAGASFDELLAVDNPSSAKAFFGGFASLILAMRRNPKLIIGRAQGKAVGGGVGLLAACDYCLADRHASIKLSELSIGIGPFVILPAVERKIGLAAAAQMSIAAHRWFTADWAGQQGLFQSVHPSKEELDTAVHDMAQRLAAYSAPAATALKRALWQGTDHWPELLAERAATSGQLVLQPAARAALAAIKNK